MRALVRIDNPGLSMGRIRQRIAQQAFGRSGIAQPREHEVDRGAGGIDGSVEVAPTALDTNVGLIHTRGLIGWLEMTAQPLLHLGTVALNPASARLSCGPPPGRVRRAVLRHRGTKASTEGTSAQNQLGLGLSPLEDRRSDCLFHDRFRLPAAVGQRCNTTKWLARTL